MEDENFSIQLSSFIKARMSFCRSILLKLLKEELHISKNSHFDTTYLNRSKEVSNARRRLGLNAKFGL